MPTFKLALSSTVAAMMALFCAYALGWQHAWWAAMTVWLVIQPNRHLMTGRLLARSLGSSMGSIIGAVIILFIAPLSLQLLCLGLWLLISSGLGSLFQQYRHYAFAVAGYTAAIVLMFCIFENNHDIELAYTRIFCTLLGAFFCVLWVLPLTPKLKHLQAFEHLQRLQSQIQHLFTKVSDATFNIKIHSLTDELKHLYQYVQFHLAFSNKGIRPEHFYMFIQQLSLIQGFTQPEKRAYFFTKQNGIASHTTSFKYKARYFFKYLSLQPQASHVLHSIVRVVGVYLLAITIWFVTEWQQAPLMVMTAILFAMLFSGHTRAQQALTDVVKGSLLGALFGLLFRIFVAPIHEYGWVLLILFMVLLFGAYLMNQSKTAKMAIDLNMTFLLIAQPLAQTSQQTSDILLECLAILSGIFITMIWFKNGVPFLFRKVSSYPHFTGKLMSALNKVTTYQEFIYLTTLTRSHIYTQILQHKLTASQHEATLHLLKQICIVEVETRPYKVIQQSNLQPLMQAIAQQYPHLQGE